MKKQIAIIGLSSFTRRILEQLEGRDCEILLIDKDPETVDAYKERVDRSFIADVLNEETIKQLIPTSIDSVIVDPGDRIEVSILVTNYLKKIGVPEIFVRAETEEHGEILNLVGADHVIYPNWEAALRIAPMLLSKHLLNYMPLSPTMVLAEVAAPSSIVGKKLVDSGLRDKRNLNVVAIRGGDSGEDYSFIPPAYIFTSRDILLLAGPEEAVHDFSDMTLSKDRNSLSTVLKGLFKSH